MTGACYCKDFRGVNTCGTQQSEHDENKMSCDLL